MSVLFSKLIKCANCGKNYKGKLERGKRVYVCSNYDNYGRCKREVLHEEELTELLKRRYGEDFETTKENIQRVVEYIEVKNKNVFTIHLKDDEPIILSENLIQF